MKGFSERNLYSIKRFYLFYNQNKENLHQVGAKIGDSNLHQIGANITKFLLELGKGFAYMGRQYPIQIGSKPRHIDLLFYNLELRCYVVIELKVKEFEPEHTGKLGYYIVAVNEQLKKDVDNPTIGLLICKTKDNIEAQYSLKSSSQPIGISEYTFSELLPENLKSSLPSIEEIEKELNQGD